MYKNQQKIAHPSPGTWGDDALGLVVKMSFNDISIFSSGGHFVQPSLTVWAILGECILRNISVILF